LQSALPLIDSDPRLVSVGNGHRTRVKRRSASIQAKLSLLALAASHSARMKQKILGRIHFAESVFLVLIKSCCLGDGCRFNELIAWTTWSVFSPELTKARFTPKRWFSHPVKMASPQAARTVANVRNAKGNLLRVKAAVAACVFDCSR
jgi:hypothetical protein